MITHAWQIVVVALAGWLDNRQAFSRRGMVNVVSVSAPLTIPYGKTVYIG
jgi:hypothetical protein